MSSSTKAKTREEIEALKKDWLYDPIWDIEETEGFEAHRDELLAFRREKEAEWERDFFDEVDTRATDLKCSFELARYIINLENRLNRMQERIDGLYE